MLTESIVEDAAFEWFMEQSRVAPSLTPALSRGERGSYGEAVLAGRLRDAIRKLNRDIAGTVEPASLSAHLSGHFVRLQQPQFA